MKKLIAAIGILIFIASFACNSADRKEEKPLNTTEVVTDTPGVPAKEPPYDPDPTDTVPGDRYIIHSTSRETQALVKLTLNDLLKADIEKNIIDSTSRKFIFFEYDLNGDTKNEILVGTRGSYFCGTGGCTIFLLDNQGNVINKFTVADYPVVIDEHTTNGWKDLLIPTGGKFHVMKFDGKKYPSNPSMQPKLNVLPGDGLPRALDFINTPYPWFKF